MLCDARSLANGLTAKRDASRNSRVSAVSQAALESDYAEVDQVSGFVSWKHGRPWERSLTRNPWPRFFLRHPLAATRSPAEPTCQQHQEQDCSHRRIDTCDDGVLRPEQVRHPQVEHPESKQKKTEPPAGPPMRGLTSFHPPSYSLCEGWYGYYRKNYHRILPDAFLPLEHFREQWHPTGSGPRKTLVAALLVAPLSPAHARPASTGPTAQEEPVPVLRVTMQSTRAATSWASALLARRRLPLVGQLETQNPKISSKILTRKIVLVE